MTWRRLLRILLADLPVKVICVSAAVILLLFHRVTTLTERFFSVPLDVATPAGLAVASAFPTTVRITLRGAEEAIFPVLEEDVGAGVDLQAHHSAGVYRAEVKVTRKGTAASIEPLEIRVDPQEITFTLEPLTEKRVSVTPDLRGAPAYGYELVQTSVNPQNVVVRGARSRVQSIASVPTEEIDLTGRTGSFASRVRLLLPTTLVRLAGDAAADFHATIQEAVVSRIFTDVGMVAQDLSPHLAFRTDLPGGTVEVQGTQLTVDGVKPDQVSLTVDASAIHRTGEYLLHPRPQAGSGVTILDWSPRDVTVDVVPSGK